MIFAPDKKLYAKDYLFDLFLRGKEVSIKEHKHIRSIRQNRLMWLFFACIEKETGNDKNLLHDEYVKMFLPPVYAELKDKTGKVIKTVEKMAKTSELDTTEFTIFLDKVKEHALHFFDIVLPNPEDQMFQQFAEHYGKYFD